MFVAGVVGSLWFRLPVVVYATSLLLTVALLYMRWVYILPFLALCAVLMGVSYGSLHLQAQDTYKLFFQKQVTLEGRVKEDISTSSSGSLSIQLDSVKIEGVAMPGVVLASSRTAGGALRGDVMKVSGKMKEGFGNFPASITVATILSVERQVGGDMGRVVRDWFADKVRAVIPEPQASLGIGFLTGQKSALPLDVSDSLKIAGLTHIVVASGYNLTILVRLARKVLLKVSKYLSVVSAGLMVLLFMAITGLSPSMTRAGLVSGMSLLSWYYGHAFHPIVLLPVAAAITVALQPSYVWGDVGWQLSFSAFAAVMLVSPLLHAYFFGNTEPSLIRQLLGETIAAHLVTVPIIALSFGTMSNVAIVANLLVVPFVPLAMLLTFICGLGAIIHLPFLAIVALPTSWLLSYMIHVAQFVSEIPWAQTKLTLAPLAWVAYAGIVGFALFWMWRKTKYNFRNGKASVFT